jgi:hypothetical protein
MSEEIRHLVQINKNTMKMASVGLRHFAFWSAEWRADQRSEHFA